VIGAVILAAGRSSRMGANKLIAELEGQPVICHIVDTLVASGIAQPMVILGSKADEIRRALAGRSVEYILAKDFENGIGHSIRTGISAAPANWEAAMICLGDMPKVSVATIVALAEMARKDRIVVPVWQGKRGNPVLWGRMFFAQLRAIEGDVGGRHILAKNADSIVEVAADGPGVLNDIDTQADLEAMRQKPQP
jgi:molybdenum cofactor cytidylyltransferase